MKKLALATLLATGILASPANAADGIKRSIERRSELSSFNQALVNTGVAKELRPGRYYTIIAPTNEAFDKLSESRYPCLYSDQCNEDLADIVRNHIFVGEVNLNDLAKQKKALYSIDGRLVNISSNQPNLFTIEGKQVTDRDFVRGGQIIEIDGLIANKYELSSLQNLRYYPVITRYDQTPTREVVVEKVYDPASGESRVVRRTTTVTTEERDY